MVIKISSLNETHINYLEGNYENVTDINKADICLLNSFRAVPNLILGNRKDPDTDFTMSIKDVVKILKRIRGCINTCTPFLVTGPASSLLHNLRGGTFNEIKDKNPQREVKDMFLDKTYSTRTSLKYTKVINTKRHCVLASSDKNPEIIYYPEINALGISSFLSSNNSKEFKEVVNNYIKKLISNELYERTKKTS